MTFKQYLQAIQSGNLEGWVLNNLTNGNKFAKYKANTILRKALSEGECPISRFKVYRNPDELVFGQFMYIEQQITSNVETANKLLNIASYVLRPINDKVFDNEDMDKEESHISNVLSEPCENVLRVVNNYTEERNEYINVKYKGVFYKVRDEEDDDEDDSENVDNEDDNLYWYSLVRILSNEVFHDYGKTRMASMMDVAPEVYYLRKEEQKAERERKIEEMKRRAHGTH